jgi:hypothetical protein
MCILSGVPVGQKDASYPPSRIDSENSSGSASDFGLRVGAHNDHGRMNEQPLYDFVRFAWGVVNRIAARR